MEVELSTIHSRSLLPHDTAVATLASVDDGKRTEAIEVDAVEVEVRDSSRAPSTTFIASTPAMKRKARIQFAALCWTLYLAGWNDGTTGPLLPRIQAVYHVRFSIRLTNKYYISCIAGWFRSRIVDIRVQLPCTSPTMSWNPEHSD